MIYKTIPGSLSHTKWREASNEQRALKTTSIGTIGVVFVAGNIATGGGLGIVTLTVCLGFVMVKAFANAQIAKESSKLLEIEKKEHTIQNYNAEISRNTEFLEKLDPTITYNQGAIDAYTNLNLKIGSKVKILKDEIEKLKGTDSKEENVKGLNEGKSDASKSKEVFINIYSSEKRIKREIEIYKDDNISRENMLLTQSPNSSGRKTLESNITKNNAKIAELKTDLIKELRSEIGSNELVATSKLVKPKEAAELLQKNEELRDEIRELQQPMTDSEQEERDLNNIINDARNQRNQLRPEDTVNRARLQKVIDEATSKLTSLLTEEM
jgi:hypothetical protein